MKRQIAKLPKAEREKMELEYHRMKPEDFNDTMAQSKPHKPAARSTVKRKSKARETKRAA